MDYKNYFLKCRELYKKDKPYLSSFYENPVREIPHNFFTQETKDYLLDFSKKIKRDFDSGKHQLGNVSGIKNIWPYAIPINKTCEQLIPYLEETFYGCNLFVDKVYIYRTQKIKIKKDSYLWHHDNNPNEIIKIIIYLNDVNEFNSPFEYLADENNRGILAKCTRLGPNKWEPAPDDGRLEDEVKNLIEYKNCSGKKLIGKQFTACAFSNNSIHRVNPIIKGYRDVLNIRVKPTISKPNIYISKKWTSSFGVSGAVDPHPEKDWEYYNKKSKLRLLKERYLDIFLKKLKNKIKSIIRKIK